MLLLIFSIVLWGIFHSVTASKPVKDLARSWLGDKGDRIYRLAYNLISLLTILPVFWLAAVLPDRPLYAISSPWVILTFIIQLTAAFLLVIGVLQTGVWEFAGLSQLFRTQPAARQKLVTTGLYRWVRHPLYTAGLVFIWSTPAMTQNLLVMFVGFTIYILVGAYFEEKKLLHDFGAEYAAYQLATPMLIPGLRRNK